jgi:hypothetical protein
MSMILGLTTLSDEAIERLQRDPPLVWKVLSPDDPSMYEQARGGGGLLARLFGRKAPEAEVELDLEGREDMDLDKSWHALHYLFTGTAWEGPPPLNFLVCGGREVGSIDVGYGPARTFPSAEVRLISSALERVAEDELRARYSPGDMAAKEIYPEMWDDDDTEETLDYCLENFRELKAFMKAAADRDLGLLVHIS